MHGIRKGSLKNTLGTNAFDGKIHSGFFWSPILACRSPLANDPALSNRPLVFLILLRILFQLERRRCSIPVPGPKMIVRARSNPWLLSL